LNSFVWQEAVMIEAVSTGDRGDGVRLSQLLPAPILAGAQFIGADDIPVSRVVDDADECLRGDVFCARVTPRGDGHDDVRRAIARGARGVIAERLVPTGGVPLCVVRSTDRAWAHACHALAGHPARRLHVIAVAGTSGKTTTAWLTASVLAEAGLEVGVLSDLGCLGAGGGLTEPCDLSRADVLASRLARLAAEGCTHAVVEVSSRMLAAHALADAACDTVVVTNLAAAHLDLHGTPRAYRRVQTRILGALAPEGCLVVGGGRPDDLLARAAARVPQATRMTAGLAGNALVRARLVERSLHGQTFLLAAEGSVLPITVPTPVTSFARNAACAAAVGLRYGVDVESIARGLEAAGSVPCRIERLDRGQEFSAFIDTATCGHALSSTLASLRRLTPGRLVIVAEEDAAEMLAHDGFTRRIDRWCDARLSVPAGMLAGDATATDVAAYARVDRLLSTLGQDDCLLVLGRLHSSAGGRPGSASVPRLVQAIDGWLQLAHPPRMFPRRRAA
jgi:UDP-N-acetylmuramoyl-L-alanyl-D-glutamate--2,6-diaminopimelate ligase